MRSASPLTALALLAVLSAAPARAEVTREQRLVEHTGYVLPEGEWKIGIRESSYGVTDRLQLNSYLLALLPIFNLGAKYQLVDAPNLAVSVRAYGGASLLSLLVDTRIFYGGGGLDASFPITGRLAFNAGVSWTAWQASSFGPAPLIGDSRLSWWTVRGSLHWVMEPRHVFFLDFTTPTSWYTAEGGSGHDFDMLDFANGAVGYQHSRGNANIRVNVGWGPSLFGRGPTLGVDFYLRFPG